MCNQNILVHTKRPFFCLRKIRPGKDGMNSFMSWVGGKKALREEMQHRYLNNQAQIRHQEEVIRKLKQFNREKSIKRAESREKMLHYGYIMVMLCYDCCYDSCSLARRE